jgi:7-keto-8-aminopelargonate synthetase-like enzyme
VCADLTDLDAKLRQFEREVAKIIAFESVYSMGGQISPIGAVCDLAKWYGLTSLDEVLAVGLYGPRGESEAQRGHCAALTSSKSERHRDRVRGLKIHLAAAGRPTKDNPSHIVPILVGDPLLTPTRFSIASLSTCNR